MRASIISRGQPTQVNSFCVLAGMQVGLVRWLVFLVYVSLTSGLWATGADTLSEKSLHALCERRAAPAAVRFPLTTALGDSIILADTVTIVGIQLSGQKRTRQRVIFREMDLKRGDRIPSANLAERVALSYNTLMNTNLFAGIDLQIDTLSPYEIQLSLTMRETWYLYPVPIFELADRNFNVWLNEMDASLDRVNIGAKLTYYNFTGRRDKFNLQYMTGYRREYEASYSHPYINRAGSLGLSFKYKYRRQREQNYLTVNNRQEFYEDEDNFVYRQNTAEVKLSYRRHLYVSHTFELGYRDTRIADTIGRVLNPDFFGGGRTSQEFFSARYAYDKDKRDVRGYPWKGYLIQFSLDKDGLGITGERNGLTAGFTYGKYLPLNDNYSLNFGFGGKYSLIRTQQPFLENRAIGFGNNGLVGYQFYVVDGLDMLIWRAGIRRKLFQTKINLGKLMLIEAFRYVPIRVLLSGQFNQGIANSPFVGENNPLSNQLLTGFSVGLDAVFFYDMVGSLQYNHNHLGEGGVFLALRLSF